MTWKKNMSVKIGPKITPYKQKDYTCVTFQPCLKKFGIK